MSRRQNLPRPDAADLRLVAEETEKETLAIRINAELRAYLVEHLSPVALDDWADRALCAAFRQAGRAFKGAPISHAERQRRGKIGMAARWAGHIKSEKPVVRVLLSPRAHAAYLSLSTDAETRQGVYAALVEDKRKRGLDPARVAAVAKPVKMVRIQKETADVLRAWAAEIGADWSRLASAVVEK